MRCQFRVRQNLTCIQEKNTKELLIAENIELHEKIELKQIVDLYKFVRFVKITRNHFIITIFGDISTRED